MAMSLQTAMDITQAVANPAGAAGDQQPEAEGHLPKSLCNTFNHRWHWAEVMFLFLGPAGIIMFIVGIAELGTSLHWLFGAICLAAALIGFGFNWNLMTQKRLAASVKLISQSIKEIVGLNLTMANDIRELASTKDELTMRNQQLRDNARRLGDDVKGLEDIENQLGNVLQEQRKIIQERRKNNDELDRLLSQEDELALSSARNWLIKRIKGQFESADLDGSGSITLASQEWEHLRGFLAENGFPLEARDVDLDGDGEVRRMELLRAITQRMDHHMGDLKHAMQKQRDLRRQLEEKRREVERKKINM